MPVGCGHDHASQIGFLCILMRSGSRAGRAGLVSLGPQMSRFRGVQVVFPITRNICVRKASNLYVSSAKSARARNSKSEGCFCRIVRCALRGPSQVEGRSSSRASVWLWGESARTLPDLRPPLLGRSIALLFFKARVRQQMLQPPAIGPWRRPCVILASCHCTCSAFS